MPNDISSQENREVILVDDHKVACDGGGGALGHPVTYYEMGDDDHVVCKYCDRLFALRGGEHDPSQTG